MPAFGLGAVVAERYEILALIGAGANGAVYQAQDRSLSRMVALKHLLRQADDPEREERFEKEAQVLKGLRHPCIPQILDYFTRDGQLFVSMEYVEGTSLASLVKKQGPLPVRDALGYVAQVCDILTYLHGQHVPLIHRDIKPHNILVRTSDDKVVLVDFGLARPLTANRTSEAVGTLGYCPMEQLQGLAERRSDLYAVGATLYYLLSGKPPRPLQTPSLDHGEVPPHVSYIVNMACQSTPGLRYATAEKMAAAIRRALVEMDKPVEESSPASKAPAEIASKSGCMGLGSAMVVLGLLLLRHYR